LDRLPCSIIIAIDKPMIWEASLLDQEKPLANYITSPGQAG